MVSAMTRIGMICRMDKSGLGAGQTLRLTRLLRPHRVMLIDSTPFNGAEQHHEWYREHSGVIIDGFPNGLEMASFMQDIDILISCETFYSANATIMAKEREIKTILIANPEFFDYLVPGYKARVPLPDKVIVPSVWMIDKMKEFNADYLPTPIFEDEFKESREVNLKRTGKPRYLFLNGKTAAHDRAGLESLYEALQLAKGDFEVVVKAQGEVKKHPDPRLTYDFSNPDEQWKLYAGFDAMIHPRRYGGQSLPMTEALQSGLPVIMTDCDPNNKVLPLGWFTKAHKTGEFMARTMIDIYSAIPQDLADTIDSFASLNHFVNTKNKELALELGKQYDAETLRPEYERIINEVI